MDRRQIIKALGVAGGTTLAGCSSLTNSGDGNNDTGGGLEDDLNAEWTSNEGLNITLSDYAFTDVIYLNEERITPDNNGQFLLVSTQVRNNGDEEIEAPQRDDFLIEDADGIRFNQMEYPGFGGPGSLTQPLSGDIYSVDSSLEAGGSASGYLVFEVENEIEGPTVVVPSLETADTDAPSWDLATGSSTKIAFDISINAPDEPVVQFQPRTYTVNIENTGGRTGRFERAFSVTGGALEQDTEESSRVIQTGINGGETFSEEISVIPQADYDPLSITFEPQEIESIIQPPAFAFGETYTAPSGIEYTIEDVQFTDQVTFSDSTESAESGTKFLLFYVDIVNASNPEGVDVPFNMYVFTSDTPTTGEAELRLTTSGSEEGLNFDEIESPVTGERYTRFNTGGYERGEGEQGWLVGVVDQSVTQSDLTVYTINAGEMVQWNQNGDQPQT